MNRMANTHIRIVESRPSFFSSDMNHMNYFYATSMTVLRKIVASMCDC